MFARELVATALIFALLHRAVAVPVSTDGDEPTSNRVQQKAPRNEGEEGDLFEGDIRLRPGEDPYNILHVYRHRIKRRIMQDSGQDEDPNLQNETSVPENSRLWPDNIIPFKYKPSLDPQLRLLFAEAREEWEKTTNYCIKFVPKSENHTDFLFFTDEKGCSSYVGRRGGKQEVSITSKCDHKGHAMHEIGHALGFWHEHSRRDRDHYIKIIWENIKETRFMNFGLLSDEEFHSIPDVGYDLESIMHYGAYAFSKDRKNNRTIEILVDLPNCAKEMGQRRELSFKDKLRVNKLYQCTEKAMELEDQGPSCNLSMPEPTPTTPFTTPTPTSTTKQRPSATASPKPSRIESGTVISIHFDVDEEKYAVHCPNFRKGCYKESRRTSYFDFSSTRIEEQFEIHLTRTRKNPRIKSGDKVIFRSVHKSNRWFDCSSRNDCTITECQNNAADPSNSSYITDCGYHLFRIYAVGKENGMAVRTSDLIQFKHVNDSSYLNCLDKKCILEDICEDGRDGCTAQKFTVEKI